MRRTICKLVFLLAANSASALDVTISAKAEGGGKPTVVGTTSLPDGTDLMIELSRSASSYAAQDKAKVNGGYFRAGPFSQKGNDLNPGVYVLRVTMPITAVQPTAVQQVIGSEGSNLKGSLVKRSGFGGKVVEYKNSFKVGNGTASASADISAQRQSQIDKHDWLLQSCKDLCNLSQAQALKRNETFSSDRCFSSCIQDGPSRK